MEALGIHVFAGGFTMGVRRVFNVNEQLELHGFGRETAEQRLGLEFTNCEDWDKWPRRNVAFAYGNPRCTGFSCITCGYDSTAHGPWSAPTKDIWDFCRYVVQQDIPIAIWESVQQAYTTGRPMLDALRDDVFVPAGYRIAHVLLNYATFGNSQQRRRYFFVAYKGGNFNIDVPELSDNMPTTFDAIWDMRDRDVKVMRPTASEYDADCYYDLTPHEWDDVKNIPPCGSLNVAARMWVDRLHKKHQDAWHSRSSDMPFSMHCMSRTWWTRQFPTIHSSACRFLHPSLDRPVTVGELARVMGWGDVIPAGKYPVAQIAKGVVPEAGEWLARQALNFIEGRWGSEDWESSFNPRTCRWEGRDTPGQVEKEFNMTEYFSRVISPERFPDECFVRYPREDVDWSTGRLLDPWRTDR